VGNIKAAKISKTGQTTGLGVRPIIKKKSRKKRKKGLII